MRVIPPHSCTTCIHVIIIQVQLSVSFSLSLSHSLSLSVSHSLSLFHTLSLFLSHSLSTSLSLSLCDTILHTQSRHLFLSLTLSLSLTHSLSLRVGGCVRRKPGEGKAFHGALRPSQRDSTPQHHPHPLPGLHGSSSAGRWNMFGLCLDRDG